MTELPREEALRRTGEIVSETRRFLLRTKVTDAIQQAYRDGYAAALEDVNQEFYCAFQKAKAKDAK